MGYVTVEQVIEDTGARPGDFGLDTAIQLEQLLDRWIGYVKGLIDGHYTPTRDFLAEADGNLEQVPDSVKSVAARSMMLLVKVARETRDYASIRIDESEGRPPASLVGQILPRWLRRDLPARHGTSLRMFVAHGADD